MIERMLILVATALAVTVIWGTLRLWRAWQLRRLSTRTPLSELIPTGKPAVLAFSAPHCRDCHTLQAPALERLRAQLHDRATIASVSALEHPQLVEHLGILTVPSTVVVDAQGVVRHLNLGFASDAKLREQLAQVA
jgi:thiol-disulfide isomerase/thioredoxin